MRGGRAADVLRHRAGESAKLRGVGAGMAVHRRILGRRPEAVVGRDVDDVQSRRAAVGQHPRDQAGRSTVRCSAKERGVALSGKAGEQRVDTGERLVGIGRREVREGGGDRRAGL